MTRQHQDGIEDRVSEKVMPQSDYDRLFKGPPLEDLGLGSITEDEYLELRQRPRGFDGPLFTKERLEVLRAHNAQLDPSALRMQESS